MLLVWDEKIPSLLVVLITKHMGGIKIPVLLVWYKKIPVMLQVVQKNPSSIDSISNKTQVWYKKIPAMLQVV